uniref:Murine leukemia virus integrase C-terminal domain-containing protein n=1 Tax=Chelydra serpentina TaxID=8475 RepID=A0A8C3SCI0_CHESE
MPAGNSGFPYSELYRLHRYQDPPAGRRSLDTLQPRFTGPPQVLLTTQTAVFLEGRKSWIHHSHIKPAVVDLSNGPAVSVAPEGTTADRWSCQPLSDTKLQLSKQMFLT